MSDGEYDWRTIPGWQLRRSTEERAVRVVEEDTQKSGGVIARVVLKLGLDVDDEGGDRGGE